MSGQLNDLIAKIGDPDEKSFLNEALDCYRVEAHRAAIILVWLATIDHLQKHTFKHHLADFNLALSKNPDKKSYSNFELYNFGDLKESKFIELLRSAGVISNDVRKILDEKLGIRNSAAHPSTVKITGHKATEFALDLVNNVLLSFPT